MKVRICDKCISKEVIKDLEKENIELIVECINFCGIGKNKYVAIVNNMPIISESKEEFITKIKKSS